MYGNRAITMYGRNHYHVWEEPLLCMGTEPLPYMGREPLHSRLGTVEINSSEQQKTTAIHYICGYHN